MKTLSRGVADPVEEGMHPVDPDELQHNESMVFSWHNGTEHSGGLLRLGNRINEGVAELTYMILMADGSCLVWWRRAPIDRSDVFDADGLRFDVLEPGARLRTTFKGKALQIPDCRLLIDPGAAFRQYPLVDVDMDLVHVGISPMYGPDPLADAHYEQHMQVDGSIVVAGTAHDMTGMGNRDHSWGKRDWQGSKRMRDRTFWVTFGPDLGISASVDWYEAADGREELTAGGWVHRDGAMIGISSGDVQTVFEEDDPSFYRSMVATFELWNGESITLEGNVVKTIPLRHRREGQPTTYMPWAMTDFTCGDARGTGSAAYMDVGG
jgi:hypothetical protein